MAGANIGSPAARARPLIMLAAIALVAALLAGCDRGRVYERQFLAFGTLIEVTMYDSNGARVERGFDIVRRSFGLMHETWHAWEPSAVTRINDVIRTGDPITVDASVVPLIKRSQALSAASDGLFNPAMSQLIGLWGFLSHDPTAQREPPSADAIQALLEQDPSMDDLVLNGRRLRSRNAAVRLDFGAIAKGYGIDVVIERLKDIGIENVIVTAGGDLRAIGRRGARPWRIGIRHPEGAGVMASLETRGNESVFTSGDYQRFFTYRGQRYHHIIDPRTGYPAKGTASVTVVHPNATTADAAATALFVAGPDEWRRIARSMGVRFVMLIEDQGRIHMTPAMAKRIQFERPADTVSDGYRSLSPEDGPQDEPF